MGLFKKQQKEVDPAEQEFLKKYFAVSVENISLIKIKSMGYIEVSPANFVNLKEKCYNMGMDAVIGLRRAWIGKGDGYGDSILYGTAIKYDYINNKTDETVSDGIK